MTAAIRSKGRKSLRGPGAPGGLYETPLRAAWVALTAIKGWGESRVGNGEKTSGASCHPQGAQAPSLWVLFESLQQTTSWPNHLRNRHNFTWQKAAPVG